MAANIAHHEICTKRGVSVRDQIGTEECIINICFLQWELKILACDFPLDVFFFFLKLAYVVGHIDMMGL